MNIEITDFDYRKERPVKKIKLTNDNSVSISILTMGGILNEFLVPSDKESKNIVLNFSNISDYYKNPFYIGMAIGRTGGRIKNGSMPLDGEVVTVPSNENNNTLHGGPNGFCYDFWEYSTKQNQDSSSVTLYKNIYSANDGYPGHMETKITYTLTNENELNISYTGKAYQNTFFNPTCHAYFNLSESNTILNHELMVESSQYLELDEEKIPTGNLLDVGQTPFDFRKPTLLKEAINELQDTTEKGFDDVFKLDHTGKIATLTNSDDDSIEIFSDRNGLVVFTSNSFDDSLNLIKGKGQPYMGVALEPQTLPDTHNHENFGDVTLRAGEEKTYTITYKYNSNKK
ncbi:galactose mutarotase [Pediococcus pentosaceus]|uniref:aldose epimerase family protein n=1 Tax=Pediococcus pentosaceus TaxID=1255 RepID=UPI001962CFD4|nr:aldose epimerase family protein [Pediococcus pentosaceus]MBM9930477.1 galactose mutarotase [Pediococcus pentosaceus]